MYVRHEASSYDLYKTQNVGEVGGFGFYLVRPRGEQRESHQDEAWEDLAIEAHHSLFQELGITSESTPLITW